MNPLPPLRCLTALLVTTTLGLGLWLAASGPSTATVAPSAVAGSLAPVVAASGSGSVG